jgi:SH3 domain protein
MKFTTKTLFTLLTLMFFSMASYAEYRWVKDSLYVPLRSGKGNQFRILDPGLKTGTRLTYIETVVEGRDTWAKVKTADGVEGWVRNQYLMNEPTAALKLNQTLDKLKKIEAKNQDYKSQLNDTNKSSVQLSSDLSDAKQQIQLLTQELNELKQISGDAINLHKNHQTLMQKHQLLQTGLDVYKADNQRLKDNSNQTFFLYGVGAVVVGVILTLIIPKLRGRKRYSEWG